MCGTNYRGCPRCGQQDITKSGVCFYCGDVAKYYPKVFPIKTAPMDGRYIVVYDGRFHVAKWDEDKWETGWLVATYCDGNVNSRLMVEDPSHWALLPLDGFDT